MSTLLLDMALEKLGAPATADNSPQRAIPVVDSTGAPDPIPDDYLGAAADFSGGKSVSITLSGLVASPTLTVSLWVNVQKLSSATDFLTLGDPKTGAFVWTLTPDPSNLFDKLLLSMKTMPGGQEIGKPYHLGYKKWRHIALVRNGDAFERVIGGELVKKDEFTLSGFNLSGAELRLDFLSPDPTGNQSRALMQRPRVAASAMSDWELQSQFTADITPVARFNEVIPLNVRLYDQSGDPHLAITDDPAGDDLTLEIQNVSTWPVFLNGGPADPNVVLQPASGSSALQTPAVSNPPATGASNPPAAGGPLVTIVPFTNISLTFPAGALHPSVHAVVAEAGVWDLSTDLPAPDGSVRLMLRCKLASLSIAPGSTRTLTLKGMRAATGEGTRPCRLLFSYANLHSWSGAAHANGERDKLLQIVQRTGSRFLPLEARVAGQPRVRSGDANATIQLEVTNTSTDRIVLFEPPAPPKDNAAGALIVTSAMVVELQGLLQTGATNAVIVTAPSQKWEVAQEAADGPNPRWVVHPVSDTIRIEPGETQILTLGGLVIATEPGFATLRIVYRGLPEFQLAEQTLTVERSPIVFYQGKIGVGLDDPQAYVHIEAPTGNSTDLRITSSTDPTTKLPVISSLRLEAAGKSSTISSSDKTLSLHTENDMIDVSCAKSGQLGVNAAGGSTTPIVIWNSQGGLLKTGTASGDAANALSWDAAGVIIEGALNLNAGALNLKGGDLNLGIGTVNMLNNGKNSFMGAEGNTLNITTENEGLALTCVKEGYLGLRLPSAILTPIVFWQPQGGVLNTATDAQGGTAPALSWDASGVHVNGALTAGNKQFSVDHPLRPAERLFHGSLEGPELGVYYRGEGVLEEGRATVRLPDYFEALTRRENRTVQLTAKGRDPFLLSYEDVADGRFIVHGGKANGRFSWEVRAVRADTAPLVVEPGLKREVAP